MSRDFFRDPDNYDFFSHAFDLTGDHLSREERSKLIGTISELWEEHPYSKEISLTLASLYESVGEYDVADETLTEDYFFCDTSLCMIRQALINRSSGYQADDILADIIGRQDDPQAMRRIYAFLGYTLLNDHKKAKELWMCLLEETSPHPPSGTEDILIAPFDYSVLTDLAFREQIEGIRYLIREGITENLMVEIVSFADAIPSYLRNLLRLVIFFTEEGDDVDITDPLTVLAAAGYGSADIIEGFLGGAGGGADTMLVDHIRARQQEAVDIGEESRALIHLFNWAVDPRTEEDGVGEAAEKLILSSNSVVVEMAEWILAPVPEERLRDFPPGLQPDSFTRRIETLFDSDFERESPSPDLMESQFHSQKQERERTPDTIMALTPEEVVKIDDGDLFFSYLRDHIEDGNHLDMVVRFIGLALDLHRMDEVLELKEVFHQHASVQAMVIIEAYLSVLERRYKHAHEEIERGGMDPDEAALFMARIYLATDTPKKAVEICEKLVRKREVGLHAYPILIRAYREAGSEKKAQKSENALKRLR
ncbi:hypothetical protein RJ53_07890 [Methanocalculus chunghsingensis]|uniref:Uncharacterized protein n=1 Tax=Methanocalculus chunghsingensis TaxID=156457 RepID=A0A8J8B560_9EURY|nr:hypothetical protein [Methanocalculus chunghsingensis]MBR1369416.1 hypothetical protein [Methanocalculus chunghsingensis]